MLRLVSPASEEIAFLGGARVAPITRTDTSIGRAQRNAIVLLDPSVSREHARVYLRGDGWWIENCSASNTLEVAGQMVAPGLRRALAPGDVARLGRTAMQLVAPYP
ncbi:MAG TPA: FHA domain-containing protein, partial [Ktedonobacterales bacterium]